MATSTNAGLVLTIVLLANAPADAQTSPHVSTVVNSASYGTDFSAGSFVSVFGTGLDQTDFLLCPSSLSTCTSQGQGCTASTTLFASDGQANLLLPSWPSTTANLTLATKAATSCQAVKIAATAPGIFQMGLDCAMLCYLNRTDSHCACGLHWLPATNVPGYEVMRGAVTDLQGSIMTEQNPARSGGIYTLWITGYNQTTDPPVLSAPNYPETAMTVLYAGPSYIPGLQQINFKLNVLCFGSPCFTPAPYDSPLQITQGAFNSNVVYLPVNP